MKQTTHFCDLCGDLIPEVREIEIAGVVEFATSTQYIRLQGRTREVCIPCLDAVKNLTADRTKWQPHKDAAVQRIADEKVRISAEDAARVEATKVSNVEG